MPVNPAVLHRRLFHRHRQERAASFDHDAPCPPPNEPSVSQAPHFHGRQFVKGDAQLSGSSLPHGTKKLNGAVPIPLHSVSSQFSVRPSAVEY